MHLRFDNPIFHSGDNITVRRGTKWSGADSTQPESGVYVYATDTEIDERGNEKIIGFADVLYTRTFRFIDLQNVSLELEHDPDCRTYEGLKAGIEAIYPNFSEYELVTLIHFVFQGVE